MSDKKVIDVHSITLFLISIYYFYNSFIKKQTYLIIYTEKQFFIVRNADMNLRNGWGSARHAGSGIHLWKRQLKKHPESR